MRIPSIALSLPVFWAPRFLASGFLALALLTASIASAQDPVPPSGTAAETEADAPADSDDGPEVHRVRKIRYIRFAGNRRRSDEYLKQQISTKEGQPYDAGLLRIDERYLLNYFTVVLEVERIDVKKDGKPTGDVDLIFHVKESVTVGRVLFEGLTNVKKDDFKDALNTRAGRPKQEYALERDAEMIARLHKEKGYHFVEVLASPRKTGKQDIEDIVFRVIAGPRCKVLKVIFEGAHSVKRSKLRQILKNSDKYRSQFLGLGRIFNPNYFEAETLEEDRRRLQFFYRQEGWQDAKVVLVGTRFEEENSMAVIHYHIDEGKRYSIKSYEVIFVPGGEPIARDLEELSASRLERLSVFAPGYPFRIVDIEKTGRNIRERLWFHAYAKSRVVPEYQYFPLDRNVHVIYRIHAGPKVRLGRIRILGNRHTRDNVIRRAFRKGALPGEELNIEALQGGRNRLMATRFFGSVRYGTGASSDPWGLVKSPNEDRPDEFDVELEIQETDTRNINFGAGVSTDGGVFGFVAVTWRNFDILKAPDKWWRILDKSAFRGGGQEFTLSFAPGTTFSRFSIAFSDPSVNDSKWGMGVEISRRIAAFSEFSQSTDGVYLRLGRFLDDDFRWRLSLEWSLREITLDDPATDAPVNMLDQQGGSISHSISPRLTWTHRRQADAFLNGYRVSGAAIYMGGPLQGDVDVWKLELSGSMGFRTIRGKQGAWQRARIHMSVDYASEFADTSEVPIFERYFLGGRNLRGFRFREVGPKSNGSAKGGEFRWTIVAQYTFPLAQRDVTGFGFDFHVFLDQGTLVEDVSDVNWENWRVAAGFGIGIQFGAPNQPPLTIDFAWPLRQADSDETQVVSVSFERTF